MGSQVGNAVMSFLLLGLLSSSCVDRDLAAHRKAVAGLGEQFTREELATVLRPAGQREYITLLGRTGGMAVRERYPAQGGFMVQYDCWYPYRKPIEKWTAGEMNQFLSNTPSTRDFLAKPDPNGPIQNVTVTRSSGKEDNPFFAKVPDSN